MSDQEIPGAGDDDYKSHLDEVEDWPMFKITNDKISGRIPVTKIKSWEYLPELLGDPFFNKKEFIYRGQRKYAWSLSPTLARVSGDGVVRKKIADQLLKDFKLKIRGRIKDYSILEDDDELWSVGQHHGLRTPLIDWTKSPFVALFFAFNEMDDEEDLNLDLGKKSNKYRCLYVLDKEFVEDEAEMNSVRIFEPRMDDHGRLVSQDGLFTITDYETTIEAEILDYVTNRDTFQDLSDEDQSEEIAQYICKIYIPNKEREECLKFLRKMNVHHASLFPDLIGASQHSNQLIEEYTSDLMEAEFKKEFLPEIEIERGESSREKQEKENAKIPLIEFEDGDQEKIEKQLITGIKEIINSKDIEEELSLTIANKLSDKIKSKLTTDWHKREPILAAIRNSIRSTLRGYDIYISPGDERIGRILDLYRSAANLDEQ